MNTRHRSIEELVDSQARRWQLVRQERPEQGARPVITVSRQHGAGGGELARRLAQKLGFDLFDRELIQRIAESSHLSERVVSSLDEKNRELLTDWLAAVMNDAYLSPVGYRYHLACVVGAIAHHGGAVILGRGAHLILRPGEALRVLVVAPLEARVAELARREGLAERAARRRIAEVEAERHAFLTTHFHTGFADPATFDLVVNTAVLRVDGALEAVCAALPRLGARRQAA